MKEVYWVVDGVLAGRCGPGLNAWEPGELFTGGIRGVVSLDDTAVEEAALQAAGIDHLPLYQPMILLLEEEDQRRFLSFLPPIFEFIDRMRQDEAGVLVHCYYGCDRTGTVLACYLVAREGLCGIEAIELVRDAQPSAMLAPGYEETVMLFEKIKDEFDPKADAP